MHEQMRSIVRCYTFLCMLNLLKLWSSKCDSFFNIKLWSSKGLMDRYKQKLAGKWH